MSSNVLNVFKEDWEAQKSWEDNKIGILFGRFMSERCCYCRNMGVRKPRKLLFNLLSFVDQLAKHLAHIWTLQPWVQILLKPKISNHPLSHRVTPILVIKINPYSDTVIHNKMSDACLPYDQQFDATSFNILNFQD